MAQPVNNLVAPKTLQVRWFDGYFEEFKCSEIRFGGYIIWARLSNGENRTIPVNQVRWFAVYPENHAKGDAL